MIPLRTETVARRPFSDQLGRPLRDLRISVTDRCNLRCRYCMPRASFGPGHRFLRGPATLTAVEIARLARLLVGMGIETIRLTGGEPLLRADLPTIIALLRDAGATDLAMTTNGTLLSRSASEVRAAGLHRITVSLDTLDPAIFAAISDTGVGLGDVLAGIAAATRAGFAPVKLNAVIRRGLNDSSILDLVEFARAGGHVIRFIEYMDAGESNGWSRQEVVSGREIIELVARRHSLHPAPPRHPGETSERYLFDDGGGEMGVITAVSRPFCGACSRLRITADGRLHTCLFASGGTDVRDLLRRGADDEELIGVIATVWRQRSDRYSEERDDSRPSPPRAEMSYIGG